MIGDHDFIAATRFTVAACAQAVAILTINYAYELEDGHDGERVALFGWAIEAQAWAVHQFYYFVYWIITTSNPNYLVEWNRHRWITTAAILASCLAWILVASPYLKYILGRAWLIGGIAAVSTIFGVGYGLSIWL